MKKSRYSINLIWCFFCFFLLSFFSFYPNAYPAAPSSYFDAVQKMFIGYYQRPAGPVGLTYWAQRLDSVGGDRTEMVDAFTSSAESTALYGTIDNSTIHGVVDSIFQALFGRDAASTYYVDAFVAGHFPDGRPCNAGTIMLDILGGAKAGTVDYTALSNKTTAANLFTTTIDPDLDGSNFQVTYSGDGDAIAGRNFLTLYATSVKVPTQAETTAYIKANIANPGDPISTSTKQGNFIDGPVQGISYVCGTKSGVTDINGLFYYDDGQNCSFYVGNVLIGTSPGQSKVTPIELVAGATSTSNTAVVNIARFLQSLDDDQDPSNGIIIPNAVINSASSVSMYIDFTNENSVASAVSQLTKDLSGGSRQLIDHAAAELYLAGSVLELVSKYSGVYSGTYAGDSAGSFSVYVDSFGVMTGISLDNNMGNFCEGVVTHNGQAAFTTGKLVFMDVTFEGSISETGIFSGTWKNTVDGGKGTFTGPKSNSSPVEATLYKDNENVTVYSVPYSTSDPKFGSIITSQVQSSILQLIGSVIRQSLTLEGALLPAAAPYVFVIKTLINVLQAIVETLDPVRLGPIGSNLAITDGELTADPLPEEFKELAGAIVIVDNISVNKVWGQTVTQDWSSDLTLRLTKTYLWGIYTYDSITLLTNAELRALDPLKTYIIIPKRPLSTASVPNNIISYSRDVFIEASANVGVSGQNEDRTNVNLPVTGVTPPTTYSISGKVTSGVAGLSGVTVTLSGTGSSTTPTNFNGDYVFSGLTNGSYTLSVAKPGYTFIPANRNVTVSNANVIEQDFTATGSGAIIFSTQWGSYGSGNGQFKAPRGIAVDSSSNVYVADLNNNRIQKFDSNGTYLTQWGSSGSGDGQFNKPYGIAVDSSSNVYVADSFNNRIQKFSSDGTYLTQWGSSGSGNRQFNLPNVIAIDSSSNVYVADSGNNRIQKFDSNGTYLTQWGGHGIANGILGIAVDSSGNVYVSDFLVSQIAKHSSSGTFLTGWNVGGNTGIAVDSSSNVYVAESFNRIQKFSSDGTYLTQWGSSGSGNGQFNSPYNIAVDSSSNVYVVDSGNNRIQKFLID